MKLQKQITGLFLLLIVTVGIAAYSNSFDVPFQFDDFYSITDNAVVKDLDNFLTNGKGYEYNPRRFIGYLSFALNYRYGALNVTGYHITNLIIHIMNAILVYLLVLMTFRTPYFRSWESGVRSQESGIGQRRTDHSSLLTPHASHLAGFIALFAGLLFVAHPVQTQAVTYIVQRFTSLAALFYMLSVVLYIQGRLTTEKTGSDKQEAIGKTLSNEKNAAPQTSASFLTLTFYFLSLMSAVLAMKTKEIAFTLPLTIILYEFIFFSTSLKKKLIILAPVLLLLLIIPLSIMGTDRPLGETLSDLSEKTRVQTDISRSEYLFTQMRVITTYIRLIFVPVNQNLDYDFPVSGTFFDPAVIVSFLFLLSIFGLGLYCLYASRIRAKSREQSAEDKSREGRLLSPASSDLLPYYRLIAFGIFWFFIVLSVESGVIPIADVIFEHRLYLPSAGAFIAISASLFVIACRFQRRFSRSYNILLLSLALITVLLSAATITRNRVWQDEVRLWQDVVRKSPSKARPHHNLGAVYNSLGMSDQAIEEFRAAVRLKPGYWQAYNNLGVAYMSKGMLDEAMEHLITALALKPDFPEANANVGLVLQKRDMPDKAMRYFRTALQYDPNNAIAHNNLGAIYGMKGLTGQAVEHFRAALRIKPDDAGIHNNLGIALRSEGLIEEAIEHFRIALRLRPDYKEANENLDLANKSSGR